MEPIVQRGESLSFSGKVSRLATRLREPMWQRYGANLLAGKLAGVGLTLLVMAAVTGLFFAKAFAAAALPWATCMTHALHRATDLQHVYALRAGIP